MTDFDAYVKNVEAVGAAFRRMGESFVDVGKVMVRLGEAARILDADPKEQRLLRYLRQYRRRRDAAGERS